VKSIVRATAILASGSAVSVAVGLVSAKVWALLVGPTGVGLLGLIHSAIGLGGIVAGMGLGTALVRSGAHALGQNDSTAAAALQRAASRATLVLAGLTAVVFYLLREPLALALLGDSEYAAGVIWLGLAVGLTIVAGVQLSTLNAHHRVSALARAAVLSSVSGAAVSLTVLWILREPGIVYAAVAPALTSAAVATWLVRREVPRHTGSISAQEVRAATRSLFRFGVPFTASSLVGTGVQLFLPILVLHLLTAEHVGYYRAAMSLSVGYLGVLLTAMAQDYYPRVSAVAHDAGKLRELVNDQLRLITMIGAPIILLGLAFAPLIITIVYAPSFRPAAPVMEWQMLGNVFKFWSWTMSFVILARCGSSTFFFAEFIGGATMLLASWAGVMLWGLPGVGIGFVATYVVYLAVVWVIVRREIEMTITSQNLKLMGVSLFGTVTVLVLTHADFPVLSIVVALGFAAVLFLAGGSTLWQELFGRGAPAATVDAPGDGASDKVDRKTPTAV
jgi:enterobacterial common antigen flippase